MNVVARQMGIDSAMSEQRSITESLNSLTPVSRKRVLIADDERAIRDVFRRVVTYGLPDCRVDLAVNGAEAVEFFRSVHHAVVLMDLFMPVMNGQEAFEEISAICEAERWDMPAVIFCTGFDPPDGIRAIVAQNSKHCLLLKPVDHDTLLEELTSRAE